VAPVALQIRHRHVWPHHETQNDSYKEQPASVFTSVQAAPPMYCRYNYFFLI
jgi:hypothetical protein